MFSHPPLQPTHPPLIFSPPFHSPLTHPSFITGLFDERWYISCKSVEEQRQRLIKRHLETWNEEKARMFGPGIQSIHTYQPPPTPPPPSVFISSSTISVTSHNFHFLRLYLCLTYPSSSSSTTTASHLP